MLVFDARLSSAEHSGGQCLRMLGLGLCNVFVYKYGLGCFVEVVGLYGRSLKYGLPDFM